VGIILIAAKVGFWYSVAIMTITSMAWAAIIGAEGADLWKAGAMAAAMCVVSYGIGSLFAEIGRTCAVSGPALDVARAAAHGITGGIASDVQGSSFASGFASSFVGSVAGSAMQYGAMGRFFEGDDIAGVFKRTVAVALIGGTTAEIGGGKFANGAMTAAIQHLFNFEMDADSVNISKVVDENGFVHFTMRASFFREGVALDQTDSDVIKFIDQAEASWTTSPDASGKGGSDMRVVVCDDTAMNSVMVEFSNDTDYDAKLNRRMGIAYREFSGGGHDGKITMYNGWKDMTKVPGHEIGHLLGLPDSGNFKENTMLMSYGSANKATNDEVKEAQRGARSCSMSDPLKY
jgi:hypothetical protein